MIDSLPGEGCLKHSYNQKFAVADSETCNLNIINGENLPWNISLLLAEKREIKKTLDLYPWIDPLNISEGAAAVTRFNFQDYKNKATRARDCWDILSSFLYREDILIVGHNLLGFDIYVFEMFKNWLIKTGQLSVDELTPPQRKKFSYIHRILDTNCMAKALFFEVKLPEYLKSPADFLMAQLRLVPEHDRKIKTNQIYLAKYFDIQIDENQSHGSLYDNTICWQVFEKLVSVLKV